MVCFLRHATIVKAGLQPADKTHMLMLTHLQAALKVFNIDMDQDELEVRCAFPVQLFCAYANPGYVCHEREIVYSGKPDLRRIHQGIHRTWAMRCPEQEARAVPPNWRGESSGQVRGRNTSDKGGQATKVARPTDTSPKANNRTKRRILCTRY